VGMGSEKERTGESDRVKKSNPKISFIEVIFTHKINQN
jgi:hypothetical protein